MAHGGGGGGKGEVTIFMQVDQKHWWVQKLFDYRNKGTTYMVAFLSDAPMLRKLAYNTFFNTWHILYWPIDDPHAT